jgi:hypothetical protein
MTGRLTDYDKGIITRASELAAIHGPDAVSKHTGATDRTAAYVTAFGEAQYFIRELAAIIGHLGGDSDDEGQAGDLGDLEPYCATCGALIGHFRGHGDSWHHFRGAGTEASPVELFDAGHEPEVAWRPAGGQ